MDKIIIPSNFEVTIKLRESLVSNIENLSGNFLENVKSLDQILANDISEYGKSAITEHLRLCGVIPEHYTHDSSAEKLYSKYTDYLLAETFRNFGLESEVFAERADAADVEAKNIEFSFVADAKAMRLSRTAKNQKDFKIEAMDKWKYGRDYAIVVAPIYQLPSVKSQIYAQASKRNVCVLSYTHLAALNEFEIANSSKSIFLLRKILRCVASMEVSDSAERYWTAINSIFALHPQLNNFWEKEKNLEVTILKYSKEEALKYIALEKTRVEGLDHVTAIRELIAQHNFDNRINVIQKVKDNGLKDK